MVFILLSEYQQLLDEEDGRGLDSSAVRKAGIYAVAVDLDGVEKVQQGRDSQEKERSGRAMRGESYGSAGLLGNVSHTNLTHTYKQQPQAKQTNHSKSNAV